MNEECFQLRIQCGKHKKSAAAFYTREHLEFSIVWLYLDFILSKHICFLCIQELSINLSWSCSRCSLLENLNWNEGVLLHLWSLQHNSAQYGVINPLISI